METVRKNLHLEIFMLKCPKLGLKIDCQYFCKNRSMHDNTKYELVDHVIGNKA